MKLAIAALIVACPASALAQKLDVKIVDRQDNETEYARCGRKFQFPVQLQCQLQCQ